MPRGDEIVIISPLKQWFPNFFWSCTICRSLAVTTYYLVRGKPNLPNIVRTKAWKTI